MNLSKCLFLICFFLTHFLNLIAIEAPFAIQIDNSREKMLMLLAGEWVSRGLYAAAKLEIADLLIKEPKSVDELASLAHFDANNLYRLLQMLEVFGVFEEISPRVFTNTESSLLLAKSSPHTLHALTLFYGEEIHTSLDELASSIQVGTPAFQIAYNQPVFSYFKENPPRAALFQEAMKEKSEMVLTSILSVYDFSQAKTVYDIGGGYGTFMKKLLERYPNIQGTLFELPEVISAIRKQSTPLENDRLRLVSGDFFASVPKGGDVYFLKSVLHDWDDAQCQEILKQCHAAMESGSRLLIVDVVLLPKDQSVYAHCMDLLMMAITGGKERSYDAFKEIIEASGFAIDHIYPTSTEFSIIEARKK